VQEYWLSIVTFFPLAGALLLLFVPGSARESLRRLALLISVGELALAVPLLLWFDSAQRGIQFAERHVWISSPPILYQLGLDGLSLVLVLLTAFLTPFAVLASGASRSASRSFSSCCSCSRPA
jgi:NADH-quinone oxidoreductase subunit M